MNSTKSLGKFGKLGNLVSVTAAAMALGSTFLLGHPAIGFADDDSYTMAPPVTANTDNTTADNSAPSDAASTVFNWQEIPAHQKVPLTRAVFDQGGYQLYDTVGETILIPFKNNNLYVMKFAVSPDDVMYYENDGTTPILYVPQNGYLENATVPGAKWYPFTADFAPTDPVYLGVAPSWNDYVNIGWYPDMDCYGGYWCDQPVGVYTPCVGLFIAFGGNSFFGWGAYDSFLVGYPAPFYVGFYRTGIYHYGDRGFWGGRSFHGYGNDYASHGFGGDRGYGGGRTFGGDRAYGASRTNSDDRGFGGDRGYAPSSTRVFRGFSGADDRSYSGSSGYADRPDTTRSYGGGDSGGYQGANRSYAPRDYGYSGANSRSNGSSNDGSFRGGSAYGGGDSRSYGSSNDGAFHGGSFGGSSDSGAHWGGGGIGGGNFRH